MRTTFKDTKIGRIPEEWEVTTIDGILVNKKNAIVDGPFGSNMKNSDYVDSGTPVLQGKNITGNKFVWSDIRYISCEKAQELARSKVVVGDILVVKIGSIGYSALIDTLHGFENAIIPANLLKISVNEEVYSKSFLLQYLWDEKTVRRLRNSASQTAQPALSLKEVKRFRIAKPPLPEQRKITEILSTVDETIDKTDAIIEETQQLKQGLIQKLFTEGIGHTRFKETKIGRIPEEWEVVRFNQCLQKTKQKDPTKKPDEKFTYIDVSAVSNEFFKIVETKTILGKDAPSRARKGIETGDTIYATVRPYLRRVAFVPSELDGEICSTGYCVLRPKSEEISHRFIFQLMLTHRVNGYLESLQAGTSYPAISDSDVYQMLIPKPPLPEQRQIAEILSEVDSKIETEHAFKEELEQLKKGLMQVLLTGKVRVKV